MVKAAKKVMRVLRPNIAVNAFSPIRAQPCIERIGEEFFSVSNREWVNLKELALWG